MAGENGPAPTGFRDWRLHRRARITMYVVLAVFAPLAIWLLATDDDPSLRLWLACLILLPVTAIGCVVDAVQRRRHGEPQQEQG